LNTVTTARTEWPVRLALVAVAFQALFAMTHFSDGLHQEYGGVAALLLLGVAGGKRWRSVATHPLPWLVLAFIVYAVLQAACTAHLTPVLPLAKRLAANAEPVRVGVIACAIGVWMAAQPRRLPWLLGLMVAGFVLGALASLPWARLDAVVTGALALRFNYAENLVGEYAVVGLLLLSLFALSWRWHGRAAIAVALAMILVGVLLLACLLYAQSRGGWLAALLVPLVVVAYLRDTRRRWWRGTAMVLGVSASVVAVALAVGSTFVTQRLAGGEVIAEALLNGQLATLPPSSVTLRMQLAALGWHAWQAHPLFGIGLRGVEPMIVASGIHAGGYVPPHLHDAFLQIAVGLGGIGAALLLAALGVLVRELWLAHRAGDVDSALYWMLLGSLGVVLVVNTTDFLLWRAGYLRAPLELLLGCCFAVSLRHRQAARERGALKTQP
jgi:hypothetical protein